MGWIASPVGQGCSGTALGSRGAQALQLHGCSCLGFWEGLGGTKHQAPAALGASTHCQNPTLLRVGKDLKTQPIHSPDCSRPHLALNTTWTGNLCLQETLKWLQPGKSKSTHKSTHLVHGLHSAGVMIVLPKLCFSCNVK